MRTTLKRGIGQAAGLNGNGHSVVPPLFGPMVRYRQPEPPRRSLIGLFMRGFAWVVLALAVIGSGIAGGTYLYLHGTLTQISTHTKQGKAAVKELKPIASPSSPAIALIAGYDVRGKSTGANPYAGSNSDTLMLLRADPANNTLSLLSFPRDLYVNIYCHGDTVYTQNRINSAWGTCGNNGPAATLDTVQHLTGLSINYFITLDFHAFKQLVNNLHGVYMNVDRRYYIPLHTGVSAINLHPGYQKLDGGEALSYVRYRHTDSDIYRTGRQQLFIEALKSRLRTALSPTSLPLEVPKLVGVLKHNIEIGKAGGGSVDLGELDEVPRPPVPPAARAPLPQRDPDSARSTTSRPRPAPTSSRPPRARSPRRCTASSTPMSASHRRSTGSSAATSPPRRSRRCTSSRGRRSRSSSSTRAPSRARPPKRATSSRGAATRRRRCRRATRRTRRRCSATRPSTTTWPSPTRSRPRRRFGRSSARTPGSSR